MFNNPEVLRAIKSNRNGAVEGIFDNDKDRDAFVAMYNAAPGFVGVYVVMNPVNEAFIKSKTMNTTYTDNCATDKDIERRLNIYWDFDRVKTPDNKEQPATDEERRATVVAAEAFVLRMEEYGWQFPAMLCDSGNGTHVIYRTDLPSNKATDDLVKGLYAAVAKAGFDVDQAVKNASRVTRYYGTINRKTETADRKNRQSSMKRSVEEPTVITAELIRKATLGLTPPPAKPVGRPAKAAPAGVRRNAIKTQLAAARHSGLECTLKMAERFCAECVPPYTQDDELAEMPGIVKWMNENLPLGRVKTDIYVSTDVHTMSDECLRHLIIQNVPPTLFVRNRMLTMMSHVNGKPILQFMDKDVLYSLLDRRFRFIIMSQMGEVEQRLQVPVVNDMLAWKENYVFPNIQAVVTCPIITSSGEIVSGNNYSREHEVWVNTDIVPTVPAEPTEQEFKAAISLIDDLLCDFPWSTPADRANAFGMMLSAVTMYMLPTRKNSMGLVYGRVPMFIITKNTYGSGASYLAQIAMILMTGSTVGVTSYVSQDEEMAKVITTMVKNGCSYMLLDNWDGQRIDNKQVVTMLSNDAWKGRELGHSRDIEQLFRPLVIATGNGVRAPQDVLRRSVVISMTSPVEKPAERDPASFKVQNIIQTVTSERQRYLEAMFTIVRYWQQHRPATFKPKYIPKGGFEGWTDVIGSIMDMVDDTFLTNDVSEMDTEMEEWVELMSAWEIKYGLERITHMSVKSWLTEDYQSDGKELYKTILQSLERVFSFPDKRQFKLVRARKGNDKCLQLVSVAAQKTFV